jgi:hypothetical protein
MLKEIAYLGLGKKLLAALCFKHEENNTNFPFSGFTNLFNSGNSNNC